MAGVRGWVEAGRDGVRPFVFTTLGDTGRQMPEVPNHPDLTPQKVTDR